MPKAFHEIDVHVSHVEEANAMIQEAVWNWNGWVEAGQMHEWQTGQGSSLDLKQFSYGLADAWVTDSVCI